MKKDCIICKSFTVEQKQQLATSTSKARKEKENNKTATPTLVNPVDCEILGRVEGDMVVEETPASKKKKSNSKDTP